MFHIFYLFSLQALECGFKKIKRSDLERTLSVCVKNNETLHDILEMTLSSSTTVAPTVEEHSNSKEGEVTQSNQSEERGKYTLSSKKIT